MITVGSIVRIRSRNQKGTVIELRSGYALVLTKDAESWFPIEELEEDLSLIDRMITQRFDDGLDFILSIDAYRLHTEYKFNPYVLASSTKIKIFPHQIDEVTRILDSPRMLIADEVGLGKTITAAIVASELRARGIARRLLFIVPKALVYKWIDELNNRFEMGAVILDADYVKVNGDPFKLEEFCYVASIDYLKQEHILNMIKEHDFDLVVIDEAHKLALKADKKTKRLKLGEKMAEKANHLLFLSATPHNGDDEDFLARMRLLDPYIVDSTSHLIIRSLKEDVIDLDGREVFPPRYSTTVPIRLSHAEERLHQRVDGYITRMLNEARDKREYNAMRFLYTIIRKRASSSIEALRLTLKRRAEKLRDGRVSTIDVENAIERIRESEEEFDEDYESHEESIIGLPPNRGELRDIDELLAEIDKIDNDSKLKTLLDFIAKIKEGDKDAKIVVFSEYKDTVSYLFERLSRLYKTGRIDGSMSIEERKRALDEFRNRQEIMVCTDAAGEGIDMQFANIMINYDLPWNPTRLEQRMGRIHRIGQRRPVYYYNFVLSGTIDGYILEKILEKVQVIKDSIGDRLYDIIGRLLTEDDITKLYEELLKAPREEWEARIKHTSNIIEERRRMLEEIDKLLSGYRFDKTKLNDLKRVRLEAVDKGEIKRFVEIYLGHKGGRIEPIRSEDDVYKVRLPTNLAYRLGRGIIVGSFSATVAEQQNYHYLALGDRHVMEILLDAMKPCTAILEHPTLGGVLFIYRVIIKDRKGEERDGKIISLLYTGEKVIDIDPRSIWDLEPIYSLVQIDGDTLMEGKKEVENRLSEIVDEIKVRNKEKIDKIKEKTKNIMIAYFAKKIEERKGKIHEYEQRIYENPNYRKLRDKEEKELNIMEQELKNKLKELDYKFDIYSIIEPIGVAWVIKGDKADLKHEVEVAGINAVLRYERERAKTKEDLDKIKDVSEQQRGYDIESFDRVIEVKSFSGSGIVELTSNEWNTAMRMGEFYWLYVVEDALKEPKINTIQNPVERFKKSVKMVPITDYRYIIENWKIEC